MNTDGTQLLDRLEEQHAELFKKYSPAAAIRAFDTSPSEAHYHYVPAELTSLWSSLSDEFGEAGFEAFQKAVLLELITAFSSRAVGREYTQAVHERFKRSFDRILAALADDDFTHYRSVNDILLKDLAICRQKVFPAGGARVVETDAGFPRSLLFRGGAGQALRVARVLLELGGNRPFYSHHTHLCELEEFNPEGFRECNLRLAEMLQLHPEIKGIHCGSWLYDPALERVSPRLAYMRQMQEDNGAYVFLSGVNLDGGALEKSNTRRKLYEEGQYLPRSYHVIWPRRRIIAWASKQ